MVRLGWFTRPPSTLITRWTVIGVIEMLLGGVLFFLGFLIPMSGLTLLGVARCGRHGTIGSASSCRSAPRTAPTSTRC